ncbi:hypothetical protein Syun_017299 [Stephania yunnanensis]|uniref:Uncharacterized protein n=1 Tax=Stephania yunnanensis TaxID=152371 RepID=A0AAP0J6A0_9MAGN
MIVACHCEGRGWKFWGDSNLKSKFWGSSIQLDPVGVLILVFDDGKVFQWSKEQVKFEISEDWVVLPLCLFPDMLVLLLSKESLMFLRQQYEIMRREAASLRIQKYLRMHLARKAYNTLRSSAVCIQTGIRVMVARNDLRFRLQTRAAILIQTRSVADLPSQQRLVLSLICCCSPRHRRPPQRCQSCSPRGLASVLIPETTVCSLRVARRQHPAAGPPLIASLPITATSELICTTLWVRATVTEPLPLARDLPWASVSSLTRRGTGAAARVADSSSRLLALSFAPSRRREPPSTTSNLAGAAAPRRSSIPVADEESSGGAMLGPMTSVCDQRTESQKERGGGDRRTVALEEESMQRRSDPRCRGRRRMMQMKDRGGGVADDDDDGDGGDDDGVASMKRVSSCLRREWTRRMGFRFHLFYCERLILSSIVCR